MQRLPTPDDIVQPSALAMVLGPVRGVERTPLVTSGYTGARFERLDVSLATGERRRLVTKRFRPSEDWTAVRSADTRGRTTMLLAEPRLAGAWEAFACPYLGYAAAGDEVALLMEDLSPNLLPDVREPLRDEQEERLLAALAALHARFWEAPVLDLAWLARPEVHAGLFDARCAADAASSAVIPEALRASGARGWAIALRRLPATLEDMIRCPASDLAWLWRDLPRTLVHGDAKVANFALLSDGRVAAFDWALVGAGPATLDLGWYIAVNASRLTGSKEATLARYRTLLEATRGTPLDERCWRALERAAIILGARMLLWSKALALEAGRPGAEAEWVWWMVRLEAARG
jgi:hypothetical protein